MAVTFIVTVALACLVATLGGRDPYGDRARLAEARRTLRRAGRRYERGSESEAQALRILLEGGSVEQI